VNLAGSLIAIGAVALLLLPRKSATAVAPSAPVDLGELPPLDISFGGDAAMAEIAIPDAPPPGITPLQAPAEPIAASPLPGVIPFFEPRPIGEKRALASRVAEHLFTTLPGREDQRLVAMFQAQEGMRPSGYYGATAALCLAQKYGIVPPRPLYWSKTDTKRSKARYARALDRIAAGDPQRREEWQRARP
jgi:hypothetical protein